MSQLRVHPVCTEMLPPESSHQLFPGTDMHQELKSQETRTPYLKIRNPSLLYADGAGELNPGPTRAMDCAELRA